MKGSCLKVPIVHKNIRKEIERSFFNLETAREKITTTSQEVDSAKEALRLTELKFKSGISTQSEIVNHQRDLTEAEVKNIKAITDYNIHLSELRRQTGIDKIKSCIESNNIKIKSRSIFLPLCKDNLKSQS